MQLRRIAWIGVLSAGFVGSAYMVSPTSAQDAPPTTRPTTRPGDRDPIEMRFQMMARQLERMDGMTDDEKQKINDLLNDTATKLNAILTDEQKQQMQQQMQQMRNRWGNGGGRNRGGGNNGGGGGNNGGAPGQ